ncbi:MAG: ATP-binding protein [Terriglobales bacterium]|jgi:anti-sigma regulatory factor (Ser/Thr protein kinase)
MSKILLIGKDFEVNRAIGQALAESACGFECAAGDADALARIRRGSFDVLVTCPISSVEEDLSLLEEVRLIRPGVKLIILVPQTTPEDVIAALRARAFVCFAAPFAAGEIADIAAQGALEADWRNDIQVLSARRGWISLRVNCRRLTAERLITFLREMPSDLTPAIHDSLMLAFREVLLNAMEHGAKFDPGKVVEVAVVRTARAIVMYVRDPGEGFRLASLPHAAVCNPANDPIAHVERREAEGMRPGGYGILMARNIVDEMMYNEVGNEVLLIKHLDCGV